jgi:hypothetical protein
VILSGQQVAEDFDPTQEWKLQAGELTPLPSEIPMVRKKAQTFDEATVALVKKRDEVTRARREARSAEQQLEVSKSIIEAKDVKSDSVKAKKPIEPDDYKFDEMDEGEET